MPKIKYLPTGLSIKGSILPTDNGSFELGDATHKFANIHTDVLTTSSAVSGSNKLPDMRNTGYDYDQVKKYIDDLAKPHLKSGMLIKTENTNIVTTNVYGEGIYSPSENRVYFTPVRGNDPSNLFHCIDCNDGTIVSYGGVSTLGSSSSCHGSAYSPTQDRIYFVPSTNSSDAVYYYIDCATSTLTSYTHGFTIPIRAFWGGSYSPTQNRIYFAPYRDAPSVNWYYMDCDTGTLVAYANGVTAVVDAYRGSVYEPFNNRIYFVPWQQSTETDWHYIDCDTGAVVAYAHGATVVSKGYTNGAYSPTLNRIYLEPVNQSSETDWHYIDCDTGAAVAFTHGIVNAQSFGGIVFVPTQNRIYFGPNNANPLLVYINETGAVITTTIDSTLAGDGLVYSPTNNLVYQGWWNNLTRNTLIPLSGGDVSVSLLSHSMMNN
jgi:hypothetical protein